MEEKINIAELLKDCPKGMELYSPMFGTVYFEAVIDTGNATLIKVLTSCNSVYEFYPDGKFNTYYADSETTLFPSKGQRDWSKFQPPFKDGDVITCTNSACSFVAIFKETNTDTTFRHYVSLILDDEQQCCTKEGWADFKNPRFATEEEKQKLFDAIEKNGYKWNAETKTLEKLIEPKFKVGDRIKHKYDKDKTVIHTINYIYYDSYGLCDNHLLSFKEQGQYELAHSKFDITTLKPFDKVLVKTKVHHPVWSIDFYGGYDVKRGSSFTPFAVTGDKYFQQCIPYEGNEHLRGTTNDCDEYYKTWEE